MGRQLNYVLVGRNSTRRQHDLPRLLVIPRAGADRKYIGQLVQFFDIDYKLDKCGHISSSDCDKRNMIVLSASYSDASR
jgi:hypothetical protein